MDMDARDKERREAELKERNRLMAMSECEALAEGVPTWYSRMRIFREIEAAEWLKRVQAGIIPESSMPASNRSYGKGRQTTKKVYNKDYD